ncbi:MAG: dodecin domain-containing protein [Clostridia bacterium]|nr:dodecin domain-containing protein [Clostridia bacterium]
MSVTKCLNIQGTSIISFDDAIKTAYEEVSTTIDHIFDVEIIGLRCTIRDNKINEYIADTKVYFKIDTERARENGRN